MTTADPGSEIASRRRDYRHATLEPESLGSDPVAAFGQWLAEAAAIATVTESTEEPTAMSLATIGLDGHPSIRTVLLKGVDADGFVWFTNYESRKGRELASHPAAALNFRWSAQERQVSVRGTVGVVSSAESDAYFATRPLGSRIGAIASQQSAVIDGREALEARAAELAAADPSAIARPPHWGGYRLVPTEIEFWQGRTSRLHDRVRFRRDDVASPWIVERLSP